MELTHLDTYLLSYIRIVVPRPDFPDETSKRAYDEHPTNLDAWSMELNRDKRSLLDEIKSDFGVAMDHVERLRARLGSSRSIRDIRRFFSVSGQKRCPTTNTGQENLQGATTDVGSPVHPQGHQSELQSTSNLAGSSIADEFHTRVEEPRIPEITTAHHAPDHQPSRRSSSLPLIVDEVTATSNVADRRESRSTATPSPQLTASTDEEELMMRALEQDNPVQITTSAGSTDTLHMNVEVNGASPGEPVFTSSFSASPRPTLVETVEVQHVEEQRHRVTALSLQPSESISLRIVHGLNMIFRLPLEALLVRSIAHAFLASAGSSSGNASLAKLRSSVYPRNAWFGAGLRAGGFSGACDYASKMILCLGMESAVGLYVWQAGVAVAWYAGKRWYRWGQL
ncbi:hypothetical protein MMC32_001035 [Xylographa parallela]|nr:hypothetical protein [Xylographa parallela]